ncbi:Ig-like domain-containing protein [Noviherbaspirillum sp. CPCC 100848]|uniref:Ig-like domain-containing protein n=1 Tax=Noviherbaspirillum album TaxID=3080276 RepID=A0ABU6JHS7_9BURK|nr:Ig-like domain-containing protein [Noviherbaspirillum sp. CPCC 100848]MEC4722845.1 Ig-like domain-containing protein [Noviherbaspirillum sp. CPCC 100848]
MSRSMTFQVNDSSTGSINPKVFVTITEAYGALKFGLAQEGSIIGDLRGLFFDLNTLADGTLAKSFSISEQTASSSLKAGDDSIRDLGNGANMNGLLSSNGDGGFDAGITIGAAGLGSDDIRSFGFTLKSTSRSLTLDDVANVDFGVRLTSVGSASGARAESSKLLETTTFAVDAVNDSATVIGAMFASGNLLNNDSHALHNAQISSWSGGLPGQALRLDNAAGATLKINADGSYTLDATNARALSSGEVLTYKFSYGLTSANSDQSSSDSAFFDVTVVGENDGPVAEDDQAGNVDENGILAGNVDANDSDVDRQDTHSWSLDVATFNGPGALTFNPSGTWSYDTSNALDYLSEGQTLNLSFVYTMTDIHQSSDTAKVSFTVVGKNDGPDAIDDIAGTVIQDGKLAGDVGTNDKDVDLLDTHTYTADALKGAGSLVFNGNGTWSYDLGSAFDYLAAGESADVSFTYTMTDNHQASDTAAVSFTVLGKNDGPMANDDDGGAVKENEVLKGNVTTNDSDIDTRDTHTWTLVDFNGPGALTLSENGEWTYDAQGVFNTLHDGEFKDLSFIYMMTDSQQASDTAVVTFRVNGVGATVVVPEAPQGNSGNGNGGSNGNNGNGGPKGNNGWGNGDQSAPGGSEGHNNAENNISGTTVKITGSSLSHTMDIFG